MSRSPGVRDTCFQCGKGFDEDKPDWAKIDAVPSKFAHFTCLQGKQFHIPGKPGGPGEPMQAGILIAIRGANDSEPARRKDIEPVVANWTWDFEKETAADQTPVALYVLCNLLDANARKVECIHFERIPGAAAQSDKITVSFEKNGSIEEYDRHSLEHYRGTAGLTHSKLWQMIVRRLKVLGRMVDNGPNRSAEGNLILRIGSKNRTMAFHMPTNPNPYTDNKVTLIAK
jgi:hypothetical protein